MQLFYEFADNAERDTAIANAQFEMAQAKYERDMAVIEANYKYNQKLAEYKCLVENGSYDEYAHMIFLATEEAHEQKDEAKGGILQAIRDFFKRIIDAFASLFSPKVKDDEKIPEPTPETYDAASSTIEKVSNIWKKFKSKTNGNDPVSDNDFDEILTEVKAIGTFVVKVAGKELLAQEVKSKVKPIRDSVVELSNEIIDWMNGIDEEIKAKKDSGQDLSNKEKLFHQANTLFGKVKGFLDTVADLPNTIMKGLRNLAGFSSPEDENDKDKPKLKPEDKYKTSGEEYDAEGWKEQMAKAKEEYDKNNVENATPDQKSAADKAHKRYFMIRGLLSKRYGITSDEITDKNVAKDSKNNGKYTIDGSVRTKEYDNTHWINYLKQVVGSYNKAAKSNNKEDMDKYKKEYDAVVAGLKAHDAKEADIPKLDESAGSDNSGASNDASNTKVNKDDDLGKQGTNATNTSDNNNGENNKAESADNNNGENNKAESAWDDEFDVDAMFAEFGL